MSKGQHKPGGGIASRNVVKKPQRLGAPRQRAHPPGVAQLGERVGSHTTTPGRKSDTNYRGQPIFSGQAFNSGVKLGNEVATNVGAGGPGKGRMLHGQSGSQGCHGATNPGNPMPTKELWPGWSSKR